MRTSRILSLIIALYTVLSAFTLHAAGNIIVNVSPKQNPLPPNAGEIYNNIGKYMNVSITNTNMEDWETLRLELMLVGPCQQSGGFFPERGNDYISVHSNKALQTSLIVGPGQTLMLSEFDLTTHFKQYQTGSLMMSGALDFSKVNVAELAGAATIPEGAYALKLTAYSNDMQGVSEYKGEGMCWFNIAYKASAPYFISPGQPQAEEAKITDQMMSQPSVRFAWTEPTLNFPSMAGQRQFLYDFQILRIPKGSTVDRANGVFFEQLGLVSNFCDVPAMQMHAAKSEDNGEGYAVRVRARSAFEETTTSAYTLIANQGYSNLLHIYWGDEEEESNIYHVLQPKPNVVLPAELEDYFRKPIQYFDIIINNTKGDEVEICMINQYLYSLTDGLTIRTKKQHTDRHIKIEKGEIRPLFDEEIDYLLGDYELDVVQEFNPLTGQMRKTTEMTRFPVEEITVACRLAKYEEGTPVTSCKVLNRYREEIKINTESPISVKIERKQMGACPSQFDKYMNTIEDIVSVSMTNSGNKPREVVTQIVLENPSTGKRFIGYDPMTRYIDRSQGLTTAIPGRDKEDNIGVISLTDQELHERCGDFGGFYVPDEDQFFLNSEATLSGSYRLIAQLYDPKNATFNDTYGIFIDDHKMLAADTCLISTEEVNMILAWQDNASRPITTEEYFDNPGLTLQLIIDNNLPTTLRALPVLKVYGPGDKEHPDYTIVGKMSELNERAKNNPFTLESGKSELLMDYKLSKVLGMLEQVTVTGKNAGTYDVDVPTLDCGRHRIVVDLYDAEGYDGKADVTSLPLLATDEVEASISDLSVTIKPRIKTVTPNAQAHFITPADLYQVTIKNKLKHDRKVVLQTLLADTAYSDWAYYGHVSKPTDLTATERVFNLKAEQTIELNPEQINLLLGDYEELEAVKLKPNRGGKDSQETVQAKATRFARTMAKMYLYAYDIETVPSLTFPGQDAIAIDSTLVDIKSLYVRIGTKEEAPEPDPKARFKNPGKFYDVCLFNYEIDDIEATLDIVYQDSIIGHSDHPQPNRCIRVPGRGEKAKADSLFLTEAQIDQIMGGWGDNDIYILDTVKHTFKPIKDPKFSGAVVRVKAVATQCGTPTDTLGIGRTSFDQEIGEVKINDFVLHLTSSEKITDEKAKGYGGYKGDGWIGWSPMGFEIRMNVEFDSIWINEENIVTKGEVNTKQRKQDECYIPYEWFDSKVLKGTGISVAQYKNDIKNVLDQNKMGDYYNWVNDGCRYTDQIISMINKEPVTLPLGIDTTDQIMKVCPVGIQMVSCTWTPEESWVNLLGTYKMDKTSAVSVKNNILVFAAPLLAIHHDDKVLLPESGCLALMSDVTFTDMDTGFEMTCIAPRQGIETLNDLRHAEDGCRVSWRDGKFEALGLDASIVIPELMKADEKGEVVYKKDEKGEVTEEAERPEIRMTADIRRGGNWMGQVRMDSFQIPDAEGFTFTPAGKEGGILYDHSTEVTPAGVKFHEGYDFANKKIKERWTKEKREKWMGFYWEELSVRFPDWLPQEEEKQKNGKTAKSNIKVGFKDMMVDASGFSCSFRVSDIIDADLDGWKMSLDNINCDVVQNDFNNFGFNGRLGVPFLEGTIKYDAKVTNQRISPESDKRDVEFIFKTDTNEEDLKLTCLPVVDMNFKNSYFYLHYAKWGDPTQHNNEKDTLNIRLVLNGVMGLKSNQDAGFELPDIHFYNMYVGNHVESFEAKYADNYKFKIDGKTWHNGYVGEEEKPEKATIAFSLGNWSLASEPKKLGPFEFTLDKFDFGKSKVNEHDVDAEFAIKGGVNIMDGMVGAKAGLTFKFNLNWDTWDATWGGCEFEEVDVNAAFGGAKLEGKLTVIKDESDEEPKPITGKLKPTKGYQAKLGLTLPGDLIKVDLEGGYYKAKGYDDTRKQDVEFAAGFLEVALGSKAGLPLGVVKLTEIDGGFYINCRKDNDGAVSIKKGMYGGMLGLRMADASGTLMNGGFKLFVFYDAEASYEYARDEKGDYVRDENGKAIKVKDTNGEYIVSGRLSEVRLIGDLHAITTDANSEGLINAKAMILYVHTGGTDPDSQDDKEEHYFELTVTVDAKGENALGQDFAAKMQELCPNLPEDEKDLSKLAQAAKANLKETNAMGDEDSSNKSTDPKDPTDDKNDKSKAGANGEKKDDGKGGVKFNPPSAEVNIEFKVDFIKPEGQANYPWYLHVGTPQARCKFNIIDFEFGDKIIGAGAKLGANAYLCLGNTLPELPELPQKVQEFLGKKQEGIDQKEGAQSAASATSKRDQQFGQAFDPATSKGGFMMGAEVYGNFWCNALICYADVEFDAGFDIQLLKLADGYFCANTNRPPGKNGWYGQGQLYSYMKGEVGVMIAFLGEEAKYPIVSLGIGGVLKAGLPNPTWFMGKFRAQGALLGGLIEFDRTIEVKAGNVCVPVADSPLADINIWADCTPGLDTEEEGFKLENKVSPESSIRYTTNMQLDYPIELMDENLLAQVVEDAGSQYKANKTLAYRRFIFTQESANVYKKNGKNWDLVKTNFNQLDAHTYQLKAESRWDFFDDNAEYKIVLIGRAWEDVDGKKQNPYFKAMTDKTVDECPGTTTIAHKRNVTVGEEYQSVWFDEMTLYFRTGDISYDLADRCKIAYPSHDGENIYENEALHPYLCLDHDQVLQHYTGGKSGKHVVVRVSRPALKYYHSKRENMDLPMADMKNLEPLYEYDVVERAYGKGVHWEASGPMRPYPLWQQSPQFIYGRLDESGYPNEWSHVMQYIVVDENLKNGARSAETNPHLEAVNELMEQTDQILANVNMDQVKEVISQFDPESKYGYEQALDDLLAGGMSKEDAVARATELFTYVPVETINLKEILDQFSEELREDFKENKAAVNTEHTMTDEEKHLADQAEVVIWSNQFHVVRGQTKAVFSNDMLPDLNNNTVASFSNHLVPTEYFSKTAYLPTLATSSWLAMDNNKKNIVALDKVQSTTFSKLLLGIDYGSKQTFFANQRLSDAQLLTSNSYAPNDPFTLLGLAGVLGFYDKDIPLYAYINENAVHKNPVPTLKLKISNSVGSYWEKQKPIALDHEKETIYSISDAMTKQELSQSYSAHNQILQLIPTKWDRVTPNGYEHWARQDETTGYLLKSSDDAHKVVVDYLTGIAQTAKAFADDWHLRSNSFVKNASINNSTYKAGNLKNARKWGDDNDISNYVSIRTTVSNVAYQLYYSPKQIPLLYARLDPYTAFWKEADEPWFTTTYRSPWSQRLIIEGQSYYFSKQHLLMNLDYSRLFFNRMDNATIQIANDPNWVKNWMDMVRIKFRYFRPNHYESGTKMVIDVDEYSNTSTNIVDDVLDLSKVSQDNNGNYKINTRPL